MKSVHEPVLLHEVVEYLVNSSGLIVNGKSQKPSTINYKPLTTTNHEPFWYLDGTLGGGGHALALAKALKGKLCLIGLDRDPEAVKMGLKNFADKAERVIIENENFRNLDKVLEREGISNVNAILLDLGISSDELENSGRGFSFQKDEPLLMTMGDPETYPFTAGDVVNDWEESVLADIIFGYGEERFARRIARAIVGYRTKKKIETSMELAEIVVQAIPFVARRHWKNKTNNSSSSSSLRLSESNDLKASQSLNGQIPITNNQRHSATKTFQALRIAVNDELNALKEGLTKGYEKLTKGGRMAVISFHSLEDRIVKTFYKKMSVAEAKILTKKPIVAGEQELAENPRSRSAKLRILEK